MMSGSKTNAMSRNEVLAAVRAIPPEKDFVWDGVDEDDRPATEEELRAGIALAQGHERLYDKTQITLPVDNSVLAAFRATGKDWQARMNDALKDWLKEHAV
jgi:uncharacterized protein (DUF4415 family)